MSDRLASDLHKRWARLTPPLRPPPVAVAAMTGLIAQCSGPRLLLGVTPELALAANPVIAVDWSARMIAGVWPGRGPGRSVVEADWFAMPFAPASFGAALGDGVLNMLSWPDGYHDLLAALRSVTASGGRVVLRCFTMPEPPETVATLVAESMTGKVSGFHAFKWRLAMAARFEHGAPDIRSRAIWEAFDAHFPDRDALSRATGWPVDTICEIDDYAVSSLSKSFPTRAELCAVIPQGRLIESQGYDLAQCCPLLVIDL